MASSRFAPPKVHHVVLGACSLGLLAVGMLALGGCNSEASPPAALQAEPQGQELAPGGQLAAKAQAEVAPGKAGPAPSAAAEAEAFPIIEPDTLEKMIASDAPPVVYDANGDATRQEYGVVPGAKLLPGKEYDLALLPEDKAVFYCGGMRCRSADKAAKRATAAGHADVSVLRVGIRGWVKAGKPIAKPKTADG